MSSETDIAAAYKRAYAQFRYLTPIRADCGLLCGKLCCRGGDDDGMILFEGEEVPASEFTLTDVDLHGHPVRFAVCHGRCRREHRPLACRIFPLTPYLDTQGVLTVIPDPRARLKCPLLTAEMLPSVLPHFYDAVEVVFSALLELDAMRPMLEAYSWMIGKYREFTG